MKDDPPEVCFIIGDEASAAQHAAAAAPMQLQPPRRPRRPLQLERMQKAAGRRSLHLQAHLTP